MTYNIQGRHHKVRDSVSENLDIPQVILKDLQEVILKDLQEVILKGINNFINSRTQI